MKQPMIYLATPYRVSPPNIRAGMPLAQIEEIERIRFAGAARLAYDLRVQGYNVFCPMTHTLPVEREVGERDPEFWLQWDEPFMEVCDAIFVGMLPGWQLSAGVERELETFYAQEKPAAYVPCGSLMSAYEWASMMVPVRKANQREKALEE